MEYKKKYNFIVCFMLFVITLSATMFFFLPKMKDVESEKNNEISDIRQEEDQAGDNSSTLNEVKFNNFNTALRHAYNYLDNTAGYKSCCYGKFSLNIKNLVNIEQTIKTTAEINNKNSTSHVTVCTYGDGKIKNNTGFEFVKMGDQVDMRKSNERISGGFNYDNKDVVRYAMEDYLKEWNIAPEEAFTKISINKIIDETGVKIDISDEGKVFIATPDEEKAARAKEIILSITEDLKVKEHYTGKVVKIMQFGAFVELGPTKDGMIHISKLSSERVEKVEDVVKVGDAVEVEVIKVDDKGRVNLKLIKKL